MDKTSRRNVTVFIIVALFWLLFDQIIKAYIKQFAVNKVIPSGHFGLIDFLYVQNKGGAWGIFSDSTYILGFVSVLICAVILIYIYKEISNISILASFALALIFAGGLGNAIDRFSDGFVVDFIDLTFIDFPVFNIADIGITCGVVLFMVSLFLSTRKDRQISDECSNTDQAENE